MAKTGDGESLGTAEGAVLGSSDAHAACGAARSSLDTWAVELLGEASQAQARDPEHEPRAREATGFDFRLILATGIGSLRYAEDEVERAVDGRHGPVRDPRGGLRHLRPPTRRHGRPPARLPKSTSPTSRRLKRRRIERAKPEPAQLPDLRARRLRDDVDGRSARRSGLRRDATLRVVVDEHDPLPHQRGDRDDAGGPATRDGASAAGSPSTIRPKSPLSDAADRVSEDPRRRDRERGRAVQEPLHAGGLRSRLRGRAAIAWSNTRPRTT